MTDATGIPVPDGSLQIQVSLYDAPTGGNCVYALRGSCVSPTAKTVTVTGGTFSTLLGDSGSGDNPFPDSLFSSGSLWLGLTVGADAEMSPRKRLSSAPYALNADRLDGLDLSQSGSSLAHVLASTANGNLVVTGDPQGQGVSEGSLYVNPAGASSGETLFGIADNGSLRFRVRKEGQVDLAGSLLAEASSSTAQFVFRASASQAGNFLEVQDGLSNRLLAVSATSTTVTDLIVTGTCTGCSQVGSLQAAYSSSTNSTEIFLDSVRGGLTLADAFPTLGGNLFEIQNRTNFAGAWSQRYFAVSATGTSVTYNNLTNGTAFGISSSANFSGRLLNLHASATATGDLLSITSTGSGATNRAIAIDLDNGNLDNTVLSIFSDEINTSTTPADTEKFSISAGGSISADGNFTMLGSLNVGDSTGNDGTTFTSGRTTGDIVRIQTAGSFTDAVVLGVRATNNAITTGSMISSIFSSPNIGVGMTGHLNNFEASRTFSNTNFFTESGSILRAYRSVVTNTFAPIVDVTGPVALVVSDGQQQTGSLAITGAVLDVRQNYAGASGAALRILNAGAGADISLPASAVIDVGNGGTLLFRDGTNALASIMDDGTSGRLGINTAAPSADLDVRDSSSSPTTGIFQVANLNDSVRYLSVSSTSTSIVGELRVSGTAFIDLQSSGTSALCHPSAGAGLLEEITDCAGTPAADYMEMYPAAAGLGLGDLVMAGTETVSASGTGRPVPVLVRTSSAHEPAVLGVVSDPSDAGDFNSVGHEFAPSVRVLPVALKGRVRVKVNAEGGPIRPGDRIAASSSPGVGMRAVRPGTVVGQALGSWDGPGEGLVLVFVGTGFDPGLAIGQDGVRSVFSDDFAFAPAYGQALQAAVSSRELSFSASSGSSRREVSLRADADGSGAYQLAFRAAGNLLASLSSTGDFTALGTLAAAGAPGYAESYPSAGVQEGDVVAVDPNASGGLGVIRSSEPYQGSVVGVASGRTGFLAGERGPGRSSVAVSGRVPVRVVMENGSIAPGDPIASSSTPGAAMKATEPGHVIGVALGRADDDGTVLALVNPSWWNGPMATGTPGAGGILDASPGALIDLRGSAISGVAALVSSGGTWSVTSDGHMIAKKVEAETLQADELILVQSTRRASAAEGKVLAGSTAAVVHNPAMRPDSKVFISFLGDPHGGSWVSEKGEGNFTLHLSNPAASDLPFEYWIVGIDDRRPEEDEALPEEPDGPTPVDSGSGNPPTDSGSGTPQTGSGTEETGSGSGTPTTDSGSGTPQTGSGTEETGD